MKNLMTLLILTFGVQLYSQEAQPKICNQIPIAAPEVKASFDGDLVKYFETSVSEKLKKGTHAAVFRIYVDCQGKVTEVSYQRGTFTDADITEYRNKILTLPAVAAKHKNETVTSTVFMSIEVVNGKFTVTVY